MAIYNAMDVDESGKRIQILFPYSSIIVFEIKAIEGARYCSEPVRCWYVPITIKTIPQILEIKNKHSFKASNGFYKAIEKAIGETKVEASVIDKNIKLSMASEPPKGYSAIYPKGMKPYPFQEAGVYYIDKVCDGKALLADSPGLGKSAQSIMYINLKDDELKKILIVCPASLKYNWKNELGMWLYKPNKWSINILSAGDKFKKALVRTITIINYDILKKYSEQLLKSNFDLILLDESQYIKNKRSARTKTALKICKKVPKVIAISGTPIMNRPVEGWTTFHMLDPKMFDNYFQYAKRYCDAQHTRWGLDVSGASNLPELQNKIREKFMVRRRKEDVLKDLPPKVRSLIELDVDNKGKLLVEEGKVINTLKLLAEKRRGSFEKIDKLEGEAKQEALNNYYKKLKDDRNFAFAEMEKLKQEAVRVKLPYAIEFIDNILDSDKKVIVFCHHKFVVEALLKQYGDLCVVLDGSCGIEERQKAVDDFQNKPEKKLFIGSIKAAGVGITLTAASDIVFVEQDWSPAFMNQCEDRACRIGQRSSVSIWTLLINGSIEVYIAKLLKSKQEIIESVLDSNKIVDAEQSMFKELFDYLAGK